MGLALVSIYLIALSGCALTKLGIYSFGTCATQRTAVW